MPHASEDSPQGRMPGGVEVRTWLYRHPNVAVVGSAVVVEMMALLTTVRLAEHRWGWAAVDFVLTVVAVHRFRTWWGRT